MDPRILLVALFVLFRVASAVNRQRKKSAAEGGVSGDGGMGDLSGRSMPAGTRRGLGGRNINSMNPMNRRQSGAPQPANAKQSHKRNPDDPFDGMNGDVTKAALTIDDIVTK